MSIPNVQKGTRIRRQPIWLVHNPLRAMSTTCRLRSAAIARSGAYRHGPPSAGTDSRHEPRSREAPRLVAATSSTCYPHHVYVFKLFLVFALWFVPASIPTMRQHSTVKMIYKFTLLIVEETRQDRNAVDEARSGKLVSIRERVRSRSQLAELVRQTRKANILAFGYGGLALGAMDR